MEPLIAFNANGIEGDISRDGFRIYLQPDGVYFIRVGNLDKLKASAREADLVGVSDRNLLLGFFTGWFAIFLPGADSRPGGRELLRKMEEQPLEERLSADPSNFVLRIEDFTSSAIRAGGGSFWRRGYGTWGFRLTDGRLAVLSFHTALDRLVAQSHLAPLLGDRLEIDRV
jgi:hypothetical protein